MQSRTLVIVSLAAALIGCSEPEESGFRPADWPAYGGHNTGDRYSTLTQLTPENVAGLVPAWQFEMDDPGSAQTQPIVVDGVVFAITPTLDVIALDGASGDLRWSFPGLEPGDESRSPSRGLAYWRDGDEQILFAGIIDKLFAINPVDGTLVTGFADNGVLDVRTGLPGDVDRYYVSMSSPGIVYRDSIIVGFRTGETQPAAPGDIRSFNVRTGELEWSFHTIPAAGEFGADTWPEGARQVQGGANNWAGFALDEERGIVYAPTGSAVPDFHGAARDGDNLFANSLLALDANTGERIWHFQAVRHDIWDRDFPSPPSLITVRHEGREIDAVAQTTKHGYVFLFERATGEPLFPIEDVSVPPSTIPGEQASPTQPLPTRPAPFARQLLTEDMLTTRTPALNAWAREQFSQFNSAGQFVPLGTEKATVIFPGFDGGAEWGGSAVDPERGILYVNSNDLAWTGRLVASPAGIGTDESVYRAQCAVCHGIDLQGAPPEFPALTGLAETSTIDEIKTAIRSGKGRMPGFPGLTPQDVDRLARFVMDPSGIEPDGEAKEAVSIAAEEEAVAYRFTGYDRFFDPDGYPAVEPPWGTLNAIDMNTGEYLWQTPLGEHPELVEQGFGNTGSENYGGPVVTASGLLFIGATLFDQKMRAFDAATGELLWEYEMPYSGMATPAVYMADGRQYIVIGTSNSRNPKGEQGSAYIAFALPDQDP